MTYNQLYEQIKAKGEELTLNDIVFEGSKSYHLLLADGMRG